MSPIAVGNLSSLFRSVFSTQYKGETLVDIRIASHFTLNAADRPDTQIDSIILANYLLVIDPSNVG